MGNNDCHYVPGLPVEHPMTYSVLPALTMEGVIWLKIVKGSFDEILSTAFSHR